MRVGNGQQAALAYLVGHLIAVLVVEAHVNRRPSNVVATNLNVIINET